MRHKRTWIIVSLLFVVNPAMVDAKTPVNDKTPARLIAEGHYRRGHELYMQSRYEEALREFDVAFKEYFSLDLVYNRAVCLEKLERWQEAIDAYDRYLDVADEQDREKTRLTIKALKEKIKAAEEAKKSTTQPSVEASPPASSMPMTVTPELTVKPPSIVSVEPILVPSTSTRATEKSFSIGGPVALAVIAVAGVGIGSGMVASSHDDYSRFLKLCAPACDPSDLSLSATKQQAGIATIAIGGAAIAVDVGLWLYWDRVRKMRSTTPVSTVRLMPTSSGVLVLGTFD